MDLRIQKTYAALTDAFTKLLEEKPYEQISVAELCETAIIRRTTFYKHFADKDEFFAFFVVSMRDEFQKKCAGQAEGPIKPEYLPDMLRQTVEFLLEHKTIVDHVIDSPGAVLLLDALREVIAYDVSQAFKLSGTPEKTPEGNYVAKAAFLGGGLVQMLRKWWADGQDQNEIDDMARLFATSFEALS